MKLVAMVLVIGVGCKSNSFQDESNARAKQADLEHVKEAALRGPVVDKHRPTAKPRLDALRAIGKAAQAAAPVAAREPLAQGIAIDPTYASGNAETFAVENLVHASYLGDAKIGWGSFFWLSELETLLANPTDKDASRSTVAELEARFADLVRLKYAIVVRATTYQPPKSIGGDKFESGHVKGDAILYDVSTQARIGAFPFEVVQSDKAYVSSKGDTDAQLEKKFLDEVKAALVAERNAYLANKPAGSGASGAGDAKP